MAVEFQLVDVFTEMPYRGNSLSVFPDAPDLGTSALLRITAELRQFESIFLNSTGLQDHWRARIFDLIGELDFAGHPLLGAACVLHDQHGGVDVHRRWTLDLASGPIAVATERRDARTFRAALPDIAAYFLTGPLSISRAKVASWFTLLGSDLDPRLPLEVVSTGLRYLLVPVRDSALGRARISHGELDIALAELGAQYAYLLDAESREGRHWTNDGAVEDAATGSAAGCVAAYLSRHGLLGSDHETELRQGRFMNRPSTIRIAARHVDNEIRVSVGGDVVLIGSGRLDVLPG